MISQDLLEQRNQTVDEIVGEIYTLSNIYEEKYGCTYWNEVNLYDILGEKFMIVGVAKGEGEYYVAASLYEEISKEYNAYYSNKYCLLWDEDFLRADVQAEATLVFRTASSRLVLPWSTWPITTTTGLRETSSSAVST